MLSDLTTIYLVRHGETEWNVKGIIQGHSDSPLTESGLKQAADLSEELKDISFDYIFSSDLLRAKKTAEVIKAERETAIRTTELLRERAYGSLEGKPSTQFKEWDEIVKDMTDENHYKFKYQGDNESDEEIITRFLRFIREFAVIDPGKTILAVTHGGVMRAVLRKLGYGTYRQLRHGAVGNGAYAIIQTDGVDFFIKEVKGVNFAE